MRRWFKYNLVPKNAPKISAFKVECTPEDFYLDKRLQYYDRYFSMVIDKRDKILSIGSGRGVNEAILMRRGYDITCSDIFINEHLSSSLGLRYFKLDILRSRSEEKYDCIIAFSVFYNFNREELFRAFNNISRSLTGRGRLILDIGGAEDNLFTFFLDEFICRFEAASRWGIKKAFRKDGGFTMERVHHGYRNTNQEIVSVAEEVGFRLKEIKMFDYETELSRSALLKKMVQRIPVLSIPLQRVGRLAPYIRMFDFKLCI